MRTIPLLAVFTVALLVVCVVVPGQALAQDIIAPEPTTKPEEKAPESPAEPKTKVAPEGMKLEEGGKETVTGDEADMWRRVETLLDTKVGSSGDVEADRKAVVENLNRTMDACNEYLTKYPNGAKSAEATFRKAWLNYQLYRYARKTEFRDKAMEISAKLIVDKPKDPATCKAHALRMQLLRGSAKFDEAIAEAQAIVKEFPKEESAPEAQYYIYDLYRRKRPPEPEKATAALKELVDKYPTTPYGVKAAGMLKRATLVGQPLEITFTRPDKTTFKLSDYRGKVVLITYWSSDSAASVQWQKELRSQNDLYAKDGFVIIGVNLDQGEPSFQGAVSDLNVPWVQCFDGDAFLSPMAAAVGVTAIPSNVLVGRDGKVRGLDLQFVNGQLRQAIVDALEGR